MENLCVLHLNYKYVRIDLLLYNIFINCNWVVTRWQCLFYM